MGAPFDSAWAILKNRQTSLYEWDPAMEHPDFGPVTQFHGTGAAHLPNIMGRGIAPSLGEHGYGSYLTPDYDFAASYADRHQWGIPTFMGEMREPSAPTMIGVRTRGLPMERMQGDDDGSEINMMPGQIDPRRLVWLHAKNKPYPAESPIVSQQDIFEALSDLDLADYM